MSLFAIRARVPLALTLALTFAVAILLPLLPVQNMQPAATASFLMDPFAMDPDRPKTLDDALARAQKLEEKGPSPALADTYFNIGCKFNNDKKYDQAIEYFNKSLAVEQTLQRPKSQLDTQIGLATALLMAGKTDESYRQYEAAVASAQKQGLADTVVPALTSMAVSLMRAGRMEDAEKYLDRALASASNEKDKTEALLNLSQLAKGRGQYDRAFELLRQAMAIYETPAEQKSPNKRKEKGVIDVSQMDGERIPDQEQLQVMRGLGVLFHEVGRLEESNKAYAEMLKHQMIDASYLAYAETGIAENLMDRRQIAEAQEHYKNALKYTQGGTDTQTMLAEARALNGLGATYADQFKFAEAEDCHKRALDLAKEAGDPSLQMRCLLQLGYDCYVAGRPEAALARLLNANDLFRSPAVGDKEKSEYVLGLGKCYSALGQMEAAIRYFQEALTYAEKANDLSDKGAALNNLALAYLDTNRGAEFQKLYGEARKLYQAVGDEHELAKLDFNYAQYLLREQKIAEAIPLCESVATKMKALNNVGAETSALSGLGLAYLLSGQPQKAIDPYKRALSLASGSGAIEAQWDANVGLGKAYKDMNQLAEAEPYLRKAVELVERERSYLSRDAFKTHNLDFRQTCFTELAELLAEQGRPYESLEIAERGKARAFLDMLANRGARRIDTGLDQLKLAGSESLKTAGGGKAEPGSRSITVTLKPSSVIEETAISPINADPPSMDELKEIARKHASTVVAYYFTNDNLLTWVVNPDASAKVIVTKVPLKSLYALVQDTHKVITTSPKNPEELKKLSETRQKNLRELYNVLFKPVQDLLPKDPAAVVTIVPHVFLFSVPFASLIAPDGDYLIEKHTLAYTPALGVLRATQKLAAEHGKGDHKLLAFGNPIIQEIAFLGALPYAEKEVNKIASLYGPQKSIVKIGADANRETFSQLAPQASEIHLATHGLVDEEHPMRSALVLAPTKKADDDGLLTVKDIITLKDLKANLVVLSACQTGRGKISGDGVIGLSRAFIIAGTPSIIVSQWNVDDVMTEFQMNSFYKSYLAGASKAKALRDAQIATIKFMEHAPEGTRPQSDPNYVRANPRYWAAFQLLGEYN